MKGDCDHEKHDEYGVCICCKEHYSAQHDQHKDDVRSKAHPALVEMVIRNARQGAK